MTFKKCLLLKSDSLSLEWLYYKVKKQSTDEDNEIHLETALCLKN